MRNNITAISGIVAQPFVFSHEHKGIKYYKSIIVSKRLSGTADSIPFFISEKLINGKLNLYTGKKTMLSGQFRSYDSGGKVILAVFAYEIGAFGGDDTNTITLKGTVCKNKQCRETPLGKQITDIILAVNRTHGRSDYIPCIAWGKNAEFADKLKVGERITVNGRIQSREYQKKYENGDEETKTAYEVSANSITFADEKEGK